MKRAFTGCLRLLICFVRRAGVVRLLSLVGGHDLTANGAGHQSKLSEDYKIFRTSKAPNRINRQAMLTISENHIDAKSQTNCTPARGAPFCFSSSLSSQTTYKKLGFKDSDAELFQAPSTACFQGLRLWSQI